jgi:hypothetical protein
MKLINTKTLTFSLFLSLAPALHLSADSNDSLRYAAHTGDFEGVKQSLRDGADDIEEALEIATNQGHSSIVTLLNAWGTYGIGTSTYQGETINAYDMCLYARGGDIEVVKQALRLGADTNDALSDAARRGHTKVVKLLEIWDNGNESTPN